MLKIEHLTKHYKGSNKGVSDLSLHIAPGDIYAFIGHNGAGKTTTLKCVAGIQDFDAGTIYEKRPLHANAYSPIFPTIRIYMSI